ncbi:hypothetical protein ABZT03_28540 [Streptomyces sp. NPDC005574]|uniref:hypothetical protein n=1 Tax=Streptomyces sp. NPDC005574 TaxID=3156891 RepID=UPI0033AAD7C0
MSRTTFEDRLLAELKREIEHREARAPEAGLAEDTAGGGDPRRSPRRLLTGRRIAVGAAACLLAGLAAVVVPGSPAGSTAYAVERHGDGTVTLTIKDPGMGIASQHELARRVRPWGIRVHVRLPAAPCGSRIPRTSWSGPPVKVLEVTKQGRSVPLRAWSVTLRRGSVLVFENLERPEPVRLAEVRSREDGSCAHGTPVTPDTGATHTGPTAGRPTHTGPTAGRPTHTGPTAGRPTDTGPTD